LRLEKVSTSSTSITGVTQLASTQVGVPAATEPNAPLTLSQFQNAPVYTGNFPNGITTSTLSVSGNATIGSQTITGTLAVSGNVTVGNQTTSGNQTIDGTLTVDGDTSLQALTATSGSFSGRVTASTLSLSGPATVANAASSGEAVTLGQADGRYQQREIIVEAGCSGTLSTNAMIGGYVNAIQVNGSGVTATLPASAVGSYAVASASATTGQTIDIVKMASGSQTLTTVGTITFAASGYTGTFSTTNGAAQTFNTGDALYIQVGSSADSTLANVLISLYLTY
jgi:cytoskeletal protein CcmA (bactofilin family)